MKYTSIPDEVFKLINNISVNESSHRLAAALKLNYESVMDGINTCFEIASSITGLTSQKLVSGSDFRSSDQDSNRFDAMLAEIRTIVFLDKSGFTDIKPLKALKDSKEADILAKWKNMNCAVEVVCSSYQSDRWAHEKIVDYIKGRFINDRKDEQLIISAEKYQCSYKLFVVVMNSPHGVALNDRGEFINILKDVWNDLGKRNDLHLSIITGKETLGSGPDDCIFPPLP